ncbi:hypothetical protein Trydic_g16739 [Trypoxylus dichotomus]
MSATKTTEEKTVKTQPTPGPSKKSVREERRTRRRGETMDAIRLLQEALPLATDSTTSDDSDDCSTIGNTSTAESAMRTEDLQLPSARRQMKRKSSRNSSSESERRKRPGTKPATAGDVQSANAALPDHSKAMDSRVPPVFLREKARWMAVHAELSKQGVRTTKVVNTNVGIRIQPATAADYRQVIRIVSELRVQYHSYQLTEEKPLKVVIRGISEEITEDKITRDLASRGFRALCKRMLVEPNAVQRRSDSCVRHERHHRAQAGEEGPGHPMPPMPAVRPRTAELPRGCGLVKCASDGRVHEAEGCAGQVRAMLGPAHRSDSTTRCAKTGAASGTQKAGNSVVPTPMETDVPRPSTSSAKPSYAGAVKNIAAKPVARKPKTAGKSSKIPAAVSRPKPALKKPETPKPGKPAKPAVANNPARTPPGRNPTSRARWPC